MAVGDPLTSTEINLRIAQDAEYMLNSVYHVCVERAARWAQNAGSDTQLNDAGFTAQEDKDTIRGVSLCAQAIVDLLEGRVPTQRNWVQALRAVKAVR